MCPAVTHIFSQKKLEFFRINTYQQMPLYHTCHRLPVRVDWSHSLSISLRHAAMDCRGLLPELIKGMKEDVSKFLMPAAKNIANIFLYLCFKCQNGWMTFSIVHYTSKKSFFFSSIAVMSVKIHFSSSANGHCASHWKDSTFTVM